jgi:hypothetical protein
MGKRKKKNTIVITIKPKPPRDPFALHAKQRKAGPLPSKKEGKGGAKNKQRDLLNQDEDK